MDFLLQLFGPDFMPHGHCYMWLPSLLWLQVGTNALIAASYVAIAITLAYLVRRGKYLPFKGTALAFGAFIISCGITHLMDIYVIWYPAYWVDGAIRAITAIASVGTAIILPRLVPQAIALARGAKAARERGIELESAVDDLGRLYEKAKELDQVKTQFFANVSHELRTPLALILGPCEKLLAADNLSDAQRHDVDVMQRNARTVLKHVNDLLEIAKLEGGKLEPQYARVDVAALVRLTAAQFDALAKERQIDYRIDTPEQLFAEVDPDKFQRILLNLLSNAFKFTPAPGVVRCSMQLESPGRIRLQVADSGAGIQPAQRRKVFERFSQLEGGSTRRFGGTGLGLTIVKDFVELQRGEIEVADAPERGALFTVTMPASAPEGVRVRSEWQVEPSEFDQQFTQAVDELRQRVEAFASGDAAHSGVVLVVEDNEDMNRFVCESLTEVGFKAVSAADGREGVERAGELELDLVLTDVMMPNMSGDELVRALREERKFDGVPIMLLTAKADDELRVRMLQEGAQDYLMKPFSAAELLARVHNLVTMKRARDLLQRELDTQMRDLESLAREVTERKRELQSTLESMRVARDHAERASAVKSDFLRLISHELRTPLASLLLQMERLQIDPEQNLPQDKRDLIERMAVSTHRLHDLIEGLLQYSRTKAGKVITRMEPVDAVEVANEVVARVREDAVAKGLAIGIEHEANVPLLRTDGNLLRLILSNLLQNAVRYTESGRVTLAVRHTASSHRLSVTDTGLGIAPEDQGRIFEPFEQGQAVRHKSTPGVGLGLALVKEIAATLGARIELQSAPGKGSTFTLVLPIDQHPPGQQAVHTSG